MSSVAFLACETTLPGTAARREDAFEHDLMIGALESAFTRAGLTLRVIDWEAPLSAFDGVSLVLLGTAWNYQDKADAFLAKLDALETGGIAVCNPPEIVRWNITKTYLRDLAETGAATIPTLWRDDVTRSDAIAAMDAFQTDRIVIKRQVGAGAMGQALMVRDSLPGPDWTFGHPAMLQPYLPAIATEGELSFIVIDGEISHALRKIPTHGDYRIQSLYGGKECVHAPTCEEIAAVQAILGALPFAAPLYARIDMLRDGSTLRLMEAELIEPYLYPEQGPELGDRLARALARRLQP